MAKVSKHFQDNYKNVVSSNMKDNNYNSFIDFLVKHSFKNVRIKSVSNKTNTLANGLYNPNSINLYNIERWQLMSEIQKFKTLTEKFDIKEVLNEWLSELPTFKIILNEIDQYSESELNEILKELEIEQD
jgi:hypothetical protein